MESHSGLPDYYHFSFKKNMDINKFSAFRIPPIVINSKVFGFFKMFGFSKSSKKASG